MVTYKQSGVDVDLERECSKIMYEAAKLTWENRRGKAGQVSAVFDDFRGLRYTEINDLPFARMHSNSDGVGTLIELAERLSTYTGDLSYHRRVANGLVAGVTDDASIKGVEPIHLNDVLKVNKLNVDLVKQLAIGLVEASKIARVAVTGGEIEQMGYRCGGYGEFHYDWTAFAIWVGKEQNMISGYEVQPGNYVVSLHESGFRNNGLSLFRDIMKIKFGNRWHERTFQGKFIADLALKPSVIYTLALVEMTGGFDDSPQAKIKAAAHITGGGIPEKLGSALEASGYGAYLHDLFEPNELMLQCQEWGKVADREAYRTWNMGNGMLIVTEEPDKVIKIARRHGIEAKIAGEVRREKGIIIKNMGLNAKRERELKF